MKTKTKIKIMLASICVASILLLVAVFMLGVAVGQDATYVMNNPSNDIVINVNDGATFWAIANEYKPEGWDTRDFITVLKDYNGFGPYEELWAGQLLRIPQFEEFNPMYN